MDGVRTSVTTLEVFETWSHAQVRTGWLAVGPDQRKRRPCESIYVASPVRARDHRSVQRLSTKLDRRNSTNVFRRDPAFLQSSLNKHGAWKSLTAGGTAKNFDNSTRPGRTRLAAGEGPLNMRHAAIQVHALPHRRLPTAICS
ncbi:hypothetical protein MTO96_009132 [Rhipicephalus appendiculatus]